ncbi:MAG: response regulator [Cyanobacteria bacterium RYN_339]|nr:response regulator [Cyanobacteria bacterium RYN_339]
MANVRPLAVLVVEDEPYTLEIMATLLTSLGHRVVTAASGPAAIAIAEEHPGLDVALIDVRLPGFDGHEVARRLRALPAGAGAALVAISATAGAAQQAGADAASWDACLVKPLDAERIFDAITDVLRMRGRLERDETFA